VLSKKEQALLDALEPLAAAKGIELVMLEVVGAKKSPTIRVYIDTEHGVSFDELSSAQAWINDVMDEIDPFPGAYMLEVSSPGIDRPLRTPEHFARFAGETAIVVLRAPYQGRAKWTGKLAGFEDGAVLLEVDGIVERLPYEDVKKANIRGTFDFNAKA
jgi:ribosome maturation factor RimP